MSIAERRIISHDAGSIQCRPSRRVIWFVQILQHSVAKASYLVGVCERTVERYIYISKFLVTNDQ